MVADLVYQLTLLHLLPRWQRQRQAGAPHESCSKVSQSRPPALMAVPHALHHAVAVAGGAGASGGDERGTSR